ncbi:MAG: cytochrome d ubiquinol oxidase subunit II, partial [Nitrospiraceae bacterium]|nr:cytochrome d ubiquinol oxidase subunit II [Nitrospiraceae bacterium]
AAMFSYLYLPLLLILFGLIFRGVGLEFRGKIDFPGGNGIADAAIFLGSFLPALLFGVAFGNIFQGLPVDASGYHGSLMTLLNPYGLLSGLLFVLFFLMHGALYLAMKTEGDLRLRTIKTAGMLWAGLLFTITVFLVLTHFRTALSLNYRTAPAFLVMPAASVTALLSVRFFLSGARYTGAFIASFFSLLSLILTGIVGLYPNLIPSSIDPKYSLTIFNTSSGSYTLTIMTIVALALIPVVIAYQAWVYRIFRGTVREDPSGGY